MRYGRTLPAIVTALTATIFTSPTLQSWSLSLLCFLQPQHLLIYVVVIRYPFFCRRNLKTVEFHLVFALNVYIFYMEPSNTLMCVYFL